MADYKQNLIARFSKDTLMTNARRQRENPLAFIADRELFGDLIDDERFTAHYRASLASLHEHGARTTLEKLI